MLNHFAVARTHAGTDGIRRFEDHDFTATFRQRAGYGQADDARAYDYTVR